MPDESVALDTWDAWAEELPLSAAALTVHPWAEDDGAIAPGLFPWLNDGATMLLGDMVGTAPPSLLPGEDGRHHHDQLMLGLFAREEVYGLLLPVWHPRTAIGMTGFSDPAAHETWDDTLEDDDALVHHREYPTRRIITRQSVSIPYAEPRASVRSFAALLALSLGAIESTPDGMAWAFRHRMTPHAAVAPPSVSAQTRHMYGAQMAYSGLVSTGFTLRNNGASLAVECPMVGSGLRVPGGDAFLAPSLLTDRSLLWGQCRIWLADVTNEAITLPAEPIQGATQLGMAAIDLSTRVRRLEITGQNTPWEEGGYRASTGRLRGNLLTPKRRTTVTLEVDVLTSDEWEQLTWYLDQRRMALEWQWDSGEVIDAPGGGTFRYGAAVVIPCAQWAAPVRGEIDNFDTLTFTGMTMDDEVNPVLIGWGWNADEGYLR